MILGRKDCTNNFRRNWDDDKVIVGCRVVVRRDDVNHNMITSTLVMLTEDLQKFGFVLEITSLQSDSFVCTFRMKKIFCNVSLTSAVLNFPYHIMK